MVWSNASLRRSWTRLRMRLKANSPSSESCGLCAVATKLRKEKRTGIGRQVWTNILSGLAVAGLLFLIAEIRVVRRLDGVWQCNLHSTTQLGDDYHIRGIVLVVTLDDSITGNAAFLLSRPYDSPTFELSQTGPVQFTGKVKRKLFLFATKVRIVGGRLGSAPVELELDLFPREHTLFGRPRLTGNFATTANWGRVECEEGVSQVVIGNGSLGLQVSALEGLRGFLSTSEPPGPPAGWTRRNGYRVNDAD